MKIKFSHLAIITSATLILNACSSFTSSSSSSAPTNTHVSETVLDSTGQGVAVGPLTASGEAIGGNIQHSMNDEDKTKLSRALDKAPGKATQWTNASTGATYTVVPIKKVTVNGNTLCRFYSTTVTRGGQEDKMTGTACIGDSGNWQEVR